MKTKSKGKEMMKVAVVSVLALGMFSAAFIGVNHLAFALATNGATLLEAAVPPVTVQAAAYTPQVQQQETITEETTTDAAAPEMAVFTPPNITIMQIEAFDPQVIPANAISKEEAALIGAEYLWDVLGASIDGMYVEMMYIMMPGFTRPFWIGSVSAEKPHNLDFEDFRDDLDAWMDAAVFASYSFRLDAITGMRVDVAYNHPSYMEAIRERSREGRPWGEEVISPLEPIAPGTPMTPEQALEVRRQDISMRWFEMSAYEQLALSDITPERFEAYKQTALDLAQRHFNLTTVQNIQLGDAWVEHRSLRMDIMGITEDEAGALIIPIESIAFTAIDHTGREAIIQIPTENSNWRLTSVSTMHNEFIPGFSYDRHVEGN